MSQRKALELISGNGSSLVCLDDHDGIHELHDPYLRWDVSPSRAYGVIENNHKTRAFLRNALKRMEAAARKGLAK